MIGARASGTTSLSIGGGRRRVGKIDMIFESQAAWCSTGPHSHHLLWRPRGSVEALSVGMMVAFLAYKDHPPPASAGCWIRS